MYLVKFEEDLRHTVAEGLFVCTNEEYINLLDRGIYFHELAGKHSVHFIIMSSINLKIISKDEVLINQLLKVFKNKTFSGINPLNYIEEEEEEDNE